MLITLISTNHCGSSKVDKNRKALVRSFTLSAPHTSTSSPGAPTECSEVPSAGVLPELTDELVGRGLRGQGTTAHVFRHDPYKITTPPVRTVGTSTFHPVLSELRAVRSRITKLHRAHATVDLTALVFFFSLCLKHGHRKGQCLDYVRKHYTAVMSKVHTPGIS